jgi:hypothetical protein
MFLRFFKGTGPGVLLLIIFTLAAVWASAFLYPSTDAISCYETDPMPLYRLLKFVIGSKPLPGVVFSFSLVSVMAFLLVNFNTRVVFINERTFLPALIYIISGGLFPQFQLLNPVLPASIFLMMAINRIIDSYHEQGIAYNFFDAGILISTGSLFYANMIWLGLLIIIGISLLRTGNLIEIAVSLIGLVTPYLLTAGLYYITGKEVAALLSTVSYNLFSRTAGYVFSGLTQVTLIFTGILILVCVAFLIKLMSTKKIKSRKTFSLLLWVFLISAGIYVVLPSVSVEIVWIISIPVSYFLTHYFVFPKKKLVPEILFFVLFALVFMIQLWYLK